MVCPCRSTPSPWSPPETVEPEQAVDINPYVYGATALIVLLALLFIVTRFNINR